LEQLLFHSQKGAAPIGILHIQLQGPLMSATKVDVPRAYAHVSSPRRKVGFNAPGDKNAKDGSFNMNAMKNALDDVEGAKGNVVPITPNKEKSS
jgi:hypothetical protein